MREVKYSRPPGFVDPYAPAPETEPESPRTKANRLAEAKKAIGSGSPGRDSTSSAHINRVRSIRAEHSRGRGSSSNGFSTSPSSGQHGPHQPRQQQRHHHHHGKTGEHGDRNSDNYDDEGYEDGDYEDYEEDLLLDELEEFKELLAEVQRDIRVTEEVACAAMGSSALQTQSSASVGSVSDEIKLNVYLASAELRCWLVNGEVIVLSARVIKEEPVGSNSGSNKQQQQQRLEAEAEISLEDLAVLRGEDHSVLSAHHLRDDESHSHQGDGAGGVGGGNSSSGYSSPFDMATLQQIAAEMVAHVELRVDLESGARLILNLVSEEGGEGEEDLLGGAAGDEDFQFYEHDTAAARGAGAIAGTPSSLHTQSAPHTHGQQQQGGDKDSSNKTKDSRGPAGGGGGFEHDSLVSEEELGDMLIDGARVCFLLLLACFVLCQHVLLSIIYVPLFYLQTTS